MSSMKLREIEHTKIACARKFFHEISQRITEDQVKYEVVTDYGKLMDVVGLSSAVPKNLTEVRFLACAQPPSRPVPVQPLWLRGSCRPGSRNESARQGR